MLPMAMLKSAKTVDVGKEQKINTSKQQPIEGHLPKKFIPLLFLLGYSVTINHKGMVLYKGIVF